MHLIGALSKNVICRGKKKRIPVALEVSVCRKDGHTDHPPHHLPDWSPYFLCLISCPEQTLSYQRFKYKSVLLYLPTSYGWLLEFKNNIHLSVKHLAIYTTVCVNISSSLIEGSFSETWMKVRRCYLCQQQVTNPEAEAGLAMCELNKLMLQLPDLLVWFLQDRKCCLILQI